MMKPCCIHLLGKLVLQSSHMKAKKSIYLLSLPQACTAKNMSPVSYLQSIPYRVLGMPFLAWWFFFEEANKALFSLYFDKSDCSSHLILPPESEINFLKLLLSIKDTNFCSSSLFPMPFSERMAYSQHKLQAPTSLLNRRRSPDWLSDSMSNTSFTTTTENSRLPSTAIEPHKSTALSKSDFLSLFIKEVHNFLLLQSFLSSDRLIKTFCYQLSDTIS